jgi:hypothetical protein
VPALGFRNSTTTACASAEVGGLPGAPTSLTVAPLPDGRLETWAGTDTGALFTTWKTTPTRTPTGCRGLTSSPKYEMTAAAHGVEGPIVLIAAHLDV